MDYCEAHEPRVPGGGPAGEHRGACSTLARAVPETAVDRGGAARARSSSGSGRAGRLSFDALLSSPSPSWGRWPAASPGLLPGRARLRWRDFWVVVQSNGSGALPIVTLISFLVGLIIAFLGAVVLRRFGAGYYVSYLVGYGMLREMGALDDGHHHGGPDRAPPSPPSSGA